MKKILIALIIFGAGYTVAKADDTIKPVTISDVKTTVVEQGYKLKDFVVDEIQATKDYQAEQWAEARAQWAKLITKFSSK